MLSKLRNRLQAEEGFTLIELLVVILIIGILAAIAIPSFLNQKGKGEDAAAKSAVNAYETAIETFYTDHQSYDCTLGGTSNCDTQLHTIEPTLWPVGSGAGQVAVTASANSYTITAYSNPSLRSYTISNNNGSISRSCSVPSGQNSGGCVGTSW